ncbi:NAD-dependent epimerase/dehydratase family protein [Desulfovibrio sp. OttesenSCG-928-M14]|nr:NAD-dependent epimerase/dehydratase family protein [Desulfovibrio sp. OttesenSCG-928-M14]
MSSYLVTGVAGFIGSSVAAALLARGHEVVGIDNLRTGSETNIPQGLQFFQANCQDANLYRDLLPRLRYDAIFHIAGQSSGEISFDDPVYDLRTNTESTLHLLRFAEDCGCSRFIYASSMSVYGVQPDEAVTEDRCTVPESFYGVGKLASEHYLRLYAARGMRSTSLRLFNVYGPGQNMDNLRQGMVSIYMSMLVNDGHIHVKGNPNRYRDFVYIDDAVAAFLLCLERESACGKILNIGGSGKVHVGDLIDRLCALSGRPVTVEYSGMTPGDLHGIYADVNMAAKYLGYEAEVSLDEGLACMYAWYIQSLAGRETGAS